MENLLGGDGKAVVMPMLSNSGSVIPGMKMRKQFDKAITRAEVPKVIIADGTEMQYPNYILDYNDVDKISVFEKHAIGSLLNDSDEVSMYIRIKGKIYLYGRSSKEKVDEIIDIYKNFVVAEGCKIYKCVDETTKVEIKERDISKIRLSL